MQTKPLIGQLNPNRSVVARFLPASYITVDACSNKALVQMWTKEEVVNSQPRIASVGISNF